MGVGLVRSLQPSDIHTHTHTHTRRFMCILIPHTHTHMEVYVYSDSRKLIHTMLADTSLPAPKKLKICFVYFSCHSVVSNSLQPHGQQHTRLPCPSPTRRACSNSCPLSRWCHPTISSSVIPFSSCLKSFQHQGLFQRVSSLHQVAKVLEFQLQHQSFQWIFRTDFL